MSDRIVVAPGPLPDIVILPDGTPTKPPEGWSLLPPGDAGLTRRVKAAGPWWVVQVQKGRKTFSRGLWAPTENIEKARRMLERERATPAYAKRRASDQRRREKTQATYEVDFQAAVRAFLAFHPRYAEMATALSHVIAAHATPVGSGTVARTQRIPLIERAEAAVIAWLRHQTTGYDHMSIPRERGARREVRAMLARRSRTLLKAYRQGLDRGPDCPLQTALSAANASSRAEP
jgi:hypothetical protein